MAQQSQTPMKIAFALTERDGRTFWSKVGAAFTNKDGSLTVTLDALPVSGRLQIREDEPREGRESPQHRNDPQRYRR